MLYTIINTIVYLDGINNNGYTRKLAYSTCSQYPIGVDSNNREVTLD